MRALIVLATLMVTSSALAHGPTAGQAQVQLTGTSARVVLTPSARAFMAYDTSGDGRLDSIEIATHRSAIVEAIGGVLTLDDQGGQAGERTFIDVLVGRDHHTGESGTFLKIMASYSWPEAPSSLTLQYDLLMEGDEGLELTAIKAKASGNGQVRLDASADYTQGTLVHGFETVALFAHHAD